MVKQLTTNDLGTLIACDNCGKQTYDRRALPEEASLLPKGFTRANARHFVYVRGSKKLVCETCRYDVFGAY